MYHGCLSHHSSLIDNQCVNSPKSYGGGPVTAWLVEPERGLAECWTVLEQFRALIATWQKECQLTDFEAGCLL